MNINTTNLEINARITVEYVKFNNKFFLYKINTILGKNITNTYGICEKEKLPELLANPEIFKPNFVFRLFTADVPEVIRTDYHAFQKNYDKFIPKISDIFEELPKLENLSDYVILIYDVNSELMFEVGSDKPLPKSIYFDYINGWMDNEHYNLNEVLKVLEARDDVVIDTVREAKIQYVPYYNQNEDGTRQFISFCWQPKEEDWNKISEHIRKYERYNIILKEIFGFTKIEND